MRRLRFSIRGLMVATAVVAANLTLLVPLMKLVEWTTPGGRSPLLFLPFLLGLNAFGFAFYLVSREVWKMEGGMRALWMAVLAFHGAVFVALWTLINLAFTR